MGKKDDKISKAIKKMSSTDPLTLSNEEKEKRLSKKYIPTDEELENIQQACNEKNHLKDYLKKYNKYCGNKDCYKNLVDVINKDTLRTLKLNKILKRVLEKVDFSNYCKS